jgi:hypothetical protein|mmetsp:Transcript_90344/g.151118  ORF Transcript_90344/g.151118 Transcript_90344/m.151118 type:complete len:231 (-) Transcript_90344:576-1268(-)
MFPRPYPLSCSPGASGVRHVEARPSDCLRFSPRTLRCGRLHWFPHLSVSSCCTPSCSARTGGPAHAVPKAALGDASAARLLQNGWTAVGSERDYLHCAWDSLLMCSGHARVIQVSLVPSCGPCACAYTPSAPLSPQQTTSQDSAPSKAASNEQSVPNTNQHPRSIIDHRHSHGCSSPNRLCPNQSSVCRGGNSRLVWLLPFLICRRMFGGMNGRLCMGVHAKHKGPASFC